MHPSLSLAIATSLLLVSVPVCAADEVFPVAHNEPMVVRVADGDSGKLLPHQHVLLVAGYSRRDLDLALWREEAVTDGNGEVHLSNALRNLPLLRVEVLKRRNCQPDAGTAAFSTEQIRAQGLSGVDRCSALVAQDAPGLFTIYVMGKKGDTPVPAPPLPAADVPGTLPAVLTPVSAVSPVAPLGGNAAEEKGEERSDVRHTATTPAEAVPPIPFALPPDFTFSADRDSDSATEPISVPAAPRVRMHQAAARPTPPVTARADDVAKPASPAKPSAAGKAPAAKSAPVEAASAELSESHSAAMTAAASRLRPVRSAGPAPIGAPVLVAPQRSEPALAPANPPSGLPDGEGLDSMCDSDPGQS